MCYIVVCIGKSTVGCEMKYLCIEVHRHVHAMLASFLVFLLGYVPAHIFQGTRDYLIFCSTAACMRPCCLTVYSATQSLCILLYQVLVVVRR